MTEDLALIIEAAREAGALARDIRRQGLEVEYKPDDHSPVTNADLAGSTFRNTIFGVVDFTGANLKSVDFDGAIVFDETFLDTVAAQAAPDGFVRDRFELAPAPEAFAAHPRWADAWLDGLEDKTPYQIKRVKEFE